MSGIHEEDGYKFAYIGNEIMIDDEVVRVRISVKKKVGSNHFWIHNIDEYKNGTELLRPSDKTEIKRLNAFTERISQTDDDVNLRFSDREQTITSEDTSLNQTPATFTNYAFKSTDRIIDYGGGRYDTAKRAMEATYEGIKFEVVDAFNRTPEHNERIFKEFEKEKANVLTVNNVLNVINSTDVIEFVNLIMEAVNKS